MEENEVNEEVMEEAEPQEVEVQEAADALLTEEEPQPQSEPEDWRVQAVRTDPGVRQRFDQMMFGQQEAPVVPPDPVAEAEKQLSELEKNPVVLNPAESTAEDFQRFFEWQEQRNVAQRGVFEAKLQRQQNMMVPMRAGQTLNDYASRAAARMPEFKNIEAEFRQYIRDQKIDPELVENQVLMDTLAKSMLYDASKRGQKVKAPPPAVSEAYTQQGQAQRQKQVAEAAPRELSEQEMSVATFLRIDPKDYADPKWGDVNDQNWEMEGAIQYTDRGNR